MPVKKQYLYIPETFDADEFVAPEHFDYANRIVSSILWGNIMKQTNSYGYVLLKAEYLRKGFDRQFPTVKRQLVDGGVIESDNYYV